MLDQIGTANMTQGENTTFVEDRFCNPNSALALNGGWTQVPPGVYFDTPEFSISVWVYPLNVADWARVIDFGNGGTNDNIILGLSFVSLKPLIPYFAIFNGPATIFIPKSSQSLLLSQWQFLVAAFNGTNARVYLNGELKADAYNESLKFQTNVSRSMCFIGKSIKTTIGYSWSYLDELRFYNKSLTQAEIYDLMNQTSLSKY
jgi:hypothetical protein